MATLLLHSQSPKHVHFGKPNSFSFSRKLLFSNTKFYGVLRYQDYKKYRCLINKKDANSFTCCCKESGAELESASGEKESRSDGEDERPPFDISLAVILAGFAFEAYTPLPENVGKREVDEANCETVFLSELKQEGADVQGNGDIEEEVTSEAESELTTIPDKLMVDDKSAEEIRDIFSKAEGAMEAWAMLSTSLGHPSFIKSEFENICFLDNPSSDTQVVLWRDSKRNRLVVAFRGTEQTKWKDLLTDLMLVPAGFNPEGIGGDSKEEVEVHGGFLSAYDSVRTRLILLIKQAIGYIVDDVESFPKWHVYVTGHSLGGALATLLAHELSSGELSKSGAISVTMYNFGSPRVGNRKFAEVYNKKIKDSWRVVNHRDIVPTVPRLMGYCHVNQPMYLDAGDLEDALETVEQMEDGHQSDDIGEATPDVLVSELMKGEIELIEKILNTEINTFHAMKDGSALMQHMEDFYYISLLEKVRYELSQKHS
ncbi:hypothetical protein Leryth_018091 [Lithospermum erythrorhizon]|nr:hypothetical protein Leryth_018091 [Lithospermum erythrorhizon]